MSNRGRLRIALENFLNEFSFGEVVAGILEFTRERDETEWVSMLGSLLDLLIDSAKSSPELQQLFVKLKKKKHQLGATLLSGLATNAASGASSAMLAPVFRAMNAQMETRIHSNLPDLSMILDMYNRKLVSKEAYEQVANYLGYHPSMWDTFVTASKPRLGVGELINLSRRKPEAFQYYMGRIADLGWENEEINRLNAATLQYPSPQDWINFAVREATNEEQARFLGLDSNFPTEAAAEAEKSGLAPGMFKYYWRSHWTLPGLTQAMTMLHRLRPGTGGPTFTDDDFNKLLVALDISPAWHERLKAISYHPITRVDLRRVYKAGLINPEGIKDAYLDDGYNEKTAQLLTDWTIIDAEQSMRDISLGRIEKAVARGLMTELEAQLFLENLRYGDKDIKAMMDLWRYDREEERISAEVDYLVARYNAGELSINEIRGELKKLGLSDNNIKIAIANIKSKQKRKVKTLTRSDIQDLYENDMIDYESVLTEFTMMGYDKDRAAKIARLVDIRTQELREKELERALKERKRAQTDEVTDEKRVTVAEFNVQIAEAKAEIADLKFIMPDLDDTQAYVASKERIEELKKDIAFLNLSKAQANAEFAREVRNA